MSLFAARWYRAGVPLGVLDPVIVPRLPNGAVGGQATLTLGAITLTATGIVGAEPVDPPVTGSLNVTLGALTMAGTGIVTSDPPAIGTATLTLGAVTLAASGTAVEAGGAGPAPNPLIVERMSAATTMPPHIEIDGFDLTYWVDDTQCRLRAFAWTGTDWAPTPMLDSIQQVVPQQTINFGVADLESGIFRIIANGRTRRLPTDEYSAWSADSNAVICGAIVPRLLNEPISSIQETVQLGETLLSNVANPSFSLRAANDTADFEIVGGVLRWAGNGTKDWEEPDDTGVNNTYETVIRVTNLDNGLFADWPMTKIVTDKLELTATQFDPQVRTPGNNVMTMDEVTYRSITGQDGVGARTSARGAQPLPNGKHCFDVTFTGDWSVRNNPASVGLVTANWADYGSYADPGSGNEGIRIDRQDGYGGIKGMGQDIQGAAIGGSGPTDGKRVRVAYDTAINRVWFLVNGVSTNGDPELGTGGYVAPAEPIYMIAGMINGKTVTVSTTPLDPLPAGFTYVS